MREAGRRAQFLPSRRKETIADDRRWTRFFERGAVVVILESIRRKRRFRNALSAGPDRVGASRGDLATVGARRDEAT